MQLQPAAANSILLKGKPIPLAFTKTQLSSFVIALGIESLLVLLLILAYSFFFTKHIDVVTQPVMLQVSSVADVPKPEALAKLIEPVSQPQIPKSVVRSNPLPKPPLAEPEKLNSETQPEVVQPPIEKQSEPLPVDEKKNEPQVAQPEVVNKEADVLAEYTARVRNAVQAAVVFPRSAEAMGLTGRVRVEFTLSQGQANQVQVIVPSGVSMFDRAAVQSVNSAIYPPMPDKFQNKPRTFQIWVEFKIR